MEFFKHKDVWLFAGLSLVVVGFHWGDDLKAGLETVFARVSETLSPNENQVEAERVETDFDSRPGVACWRGGRQQRVYVIRQSHVRNTSNNDYRTQACHEHQY